MGTRQAARVEEVPHWYYEGVEGTIFIGIILETEVSFQLGLGLAPSPVKGPGGYSW